MVPSSCHGVVFAPGYGKCHEMLSFRMVVADLSRFRSTSARSSRRPWSRTTVSGWVLMTATLLRVGIGDLRWLNLLLAVCTAALGALANGVHGVLHAALL